MQYLFNNYNLLEMNNLKKNCQKNLQVWIKINYIRTQK